MTELYKKSIKTLELPQILSQVSKFAATESAKSKIAELLPMDNADSIEAELTRVTDAKQLTVSFGELSFSEIYNISPALLRAQRGGAMTMHELLGIAANFRTARIIKSYGGERRPATSLDVFFDALCENRYFENKISAAIISQDEMADQASAQLSDIRRKIRFAREKARDTLNKIISSKTFQKSLQEPIVTIKQDRFVVPVKNEHKGEITGITHDISASGATVFIEPMQVVELNNEIRVLCTKEKNEIERILYELSAEAITFYDSLVRNYDILTELDFIFAKAKYSFEINAAQPILSQDTELYLKKARHPLIDMKKAVAINIAVGGKKDTVIITGPNTGGKTVALKTIGLLSVMTMCGLHIPADECSRVPLFSAVFADIGDEQSISQSLSTFSAHMKNIIEITKQASGGALVLFDELGAGTDPTEGAALAVAVIDEIRKAGAICAATTHYAELKAYALTTRGVENASCEFDVQTLRPTYRLITGAPGKSNAFAISARLGLDPRIIDSAKRHISDDAAHFEKMIEQLENMRIDAEKNSEIAKKARESAESRLCEINKRLETVEEECEKYKQQAREQAQEIIKVTRERAEQAVSDIEKMRKSASHGEFSDNLSQARATLQGSLNQQEKELVEKLKRKNSRALNYEFKAGEDVIFLETNMPATVIRAADKDGNILIKCGIMQITVNRDAIAPITGGLLKKMHRGETTRREKPPKPVTRNAKTSLDLRGFASDEAILELDSFINDAIMANLNTVTIIHGKGTGILRAAVQDRLKQLNCVSSFRLGKFGEGETGVTIVELI